MDETSSASTVDVVVVGAGPVGLLTALKLCLGGVSVVVVERYSEIMDIPRAIAYLPIVNKELQQLGLTEAILRDAHVCEEGPIWRKMNRSVLGAIGHDSPHNTNGQANQGNTNDIANVTLMIGQNALAGIVLDALESRCKNLFEVRFGTTVVGVQPFPRNDGLVEVMTSTKTGTYDDTTETVVTAKWVVGADGAGSFVRQACCIPFEGFTWHDFRFTACDIEYQFDVEGNYRPITYIRDPEEWAVIARCSRHNIWRIAYGERPDNPGDDASVAERSKQRIPRYLPGSKEYTLRRSKPYWAQQRCAKVFRKGRAVLVGDAAHSNNPIGGLGLSVGILDAIAIGNSMVRCLNNNEPEELIDAALENRRSVWLEKVDPLSTTNFSRLVFEDASTRLERESFFNKLNAEDPSFMANLGKEMDDLFPQNFEEPKLVGGKRVSSLHIEGSTWQDEIQQQRTSRSVVSGRPICKV